MLNLKIETFTVHYEQIRKMNTIYHSRKTTAKILMFSKEKSLQTKVLLAIALQTPGKPEIITLCFALNVKLHTHSFKPINL